MTLQANDLLEHDKPPRVWHEVTFSTGGRVKMLHFGAADRLEAVERAAAYLTGKYPDALIISGSQEPIKGRGL